MLFNKMYTMFTFVKLYIIRYSLSMIQHIYELVRQ